MTVGHSQREEGGPFDLVTAILGDPNHAERCKLAQALREQFLTQPCMDDWNILWPPNSERDGVLLDSDVAEGLLSLRHCLSDMDGCIARPHPSQTEALVVATRLLCSPTQPEANRIRTRTMSPLRSTPSQRRRIPDQQSQPRWSGCRPGAADPPRRTSGRSWSTLTDCGRPS